MIKSILRQNKSFSTRLPFAKEKIRELKFSMVNKKPKTVEEMLNKSQNLKGKTKIKFHQDFSSCYDEMNEMKNIKVAQKISTELGENFGQMFGFGFGFYKFIQNSAGSLLNLRNT